MGITSAKLNEHEAGFRKSKHKILSTGQLWHKPHFNSSEDTHNSSMSWFSLVHVFANLPRRWMDGAENCVNRSPKESTPRNEILLNRKTLKNQFYVRSNSYFPVLQLSFDVCYNQTSPQIYLLVFSIKIGCNRYWGRDKKIFAVILTENNYQEESKRKAGPN